MNTKTTLLWNTMQVPLFQKKNLSTFQKEFYTFQKEIKKVMLKTIKMFRCKT